MLADIPTEESGQGSATQSTVRQVGTALGFAVSGAALSVGVSHTVPNAIVAADLPGALDVDALTDAVRSSAGNSIAAMRLGGSGEGSRALADALSAGFASATTVALLVAAGFLALGLIASLRVRTVAARGDRERTEEPA